MQIIYLFSEMNQRDPIPNLVVRLKRNFLSERCSFLDMQFVLRAGGSIMAEASPLGWPNFEKQP
jgi:hypothetical protein